jgi:C-terminal processing protease CtpA/Prc
MTKIHTLLWSACLLALFASCEKDDSNNEKKQRLRVNEFIAGAMDDYYLWRDAIPAIPPDNSTDPRDYFHSLLYSDDTWSYITDDKETFFEEEINQTGETFGYNLAFGQVNASDDVVAVVRYVYPGSPASSALIKRGDFILKLNGQPLTTRNYTDLYKHGTLQLTVGTVPDPATAQATTVTITSRKMEQDPLLVEQVIARDGGHRIGYLAYTGFVDHYRESLIKTLARLKSTGITDLVLDLRYNPGGDIKAARLLCSAIVPSPYAREDADNPLVKHQWNARLQPLFEQAARENPSQYLEAILTTFQEVTCNLELPRDRVYVLTSGNSASASELLIVGLRPYMDVIQIGEKTHGKYTAMLTLVPEEPSISNWMILPVVSKFMNKDGYTDFKDGLAPDHLVEDKLPFSPLGDAAEPLLAKAISLITGDVDQEEDDLESVAPGREIRWLPLPAKRALDGHLLHRLPGDARFPGR